MANGKSDVRAKEVFIEQLKTRGFINAKIVASPADIVAEKNGKKWFFEIKMTKTASKNKAYFGAATITEWKQALTTPDRYFFVVAYTDDAEKHFDFVEYSPYQFMTFSTIPPFKVFFNIPVPNKKRSKHRRAPAGAARSAAGRSARTRARASSPARGCSKT